MWTRLLAIAGALAGAAIVAGSSAAAQSIEVRTDKTTYIDGFGADRVVQLTVSGLGGCAGQEVDVALFTDPATGTPQPYRGRAVTMQVPASGELHAEVPILWEQAGTVAYPGVRASCIPDSIALGDGITFLHSDPPFGPVLPPEPLPAGYSLTARIGDGPIPPGSDAPRPALYVTVGGFQQCVGRNLAYHLANEDGTPVPDSYGNVVLGEMTISSNLESTAGFDIGRVPPGRYFVWVRSVCTGTWVVPGVLEIAGDATPTPGPTVTPGAPDTGSGTAPSTGGHAMVAATIAALAAVAGGAAMVSRRRRY